MASMVHEVSQESYENKKASFRKTHPNEENKNEHKIWKKVTIGNAKNIQTKDIRTICLKTCRQTINTY